MFERQIKSFSELSKKAMGLFSVFVFILCGLTGHIFSQTNDDGILQKKTLQKNLQSGKKGLIIKSYDIGYSIPKLGTETVEKYFLSHDSIVFERTTTQSPDSPGLHFRTKYTRYYNKNFKILRNEYPSFTGGTCYILYRYDAKGNLIEQQNYQGKDSLTNRLVYTFDEKDRKISMVRYDLKGKINLKEKYSYGNSNNIIKEYTAYDNTTNWKYRCINKYDFLGRLIDSRTYYSDSLSSHKGYAYDYTSFRSAEKLIASGSLTSLNLSIHNAKGDPVEEYWCTSNGDSERIIYKYDSSGNLLYKKSHSRIIGACTGDFSSDHQWYKYDNKNRCIEVHHEDISDEYTTYNADGDIVEVLSSSLDYYNHQRREHLSRYEYIY